MTTSNSIGKQNLLSPSATATISGGREWTLVLILVLTMAGLGYALSEIRRYQTLNEQIIKQLVDETRLRKNHYDDMTIELRAAEHVVAMTRCKP